jgi:hypothetical protein
MSKKKTVAKDQKPAEQPQERRLILRTCNSDMTSHGGFVWPREGHVEAPDWAPTQQCGAGLHGFLWGEGNGGLASWSPDAAWLVAEIIGEHIDLNGKVKFRAANVIHCGDRLSATSLLTSLAPGRASGKLQRIDR